jgi:hypothetical protein
MGQSTTLINPKKRKKSKKKKTLDALTTNYRGGILSLYYPLPPSLSPLSRVIYASVLLELSFLTSHQFKGLLKSISIWNSLYNDKVLQGAQTHLLTMLTCLSRRASKSQRKECAICSRNT